MVRTIGLQRVQDIVQEVTQTYEAFTYEGKTYNIDVANNSDRLVKVANETYVEGTRNVVDGILEPGQNKEFARIEVGSGKFILLMSTSASPHPTVTYNYYIDGKKDDDLSGNAPWATPPNQFEVRPRGYEIVDSYISLQISEKSSSTKYKDVEGWLIGLIVNKK